MSSTSFSGLKEQDVHREHGYVAMSDGVRLAYVVWRPHNEGRYPVLLVYSLYGEAGMAFGDAKPYLEAGYAVVGATARGTGASEGDDFQPYRPNEGPDGAQIVEWAGVQPWSTGNVGLIGKSNQGIMGFLVGAERPPHLKAMAISGVMTSGYRDVYLPGGMFQQSYVGEWTLGAQEASARSGALRRITEWGDQEAEQILAYRKPYNLYYQMQQHPLQDDWWEKVVGKEFAAPLLDVPTMIIAGFQDEYVNAAGAATRAYAHMLPNVEHKKLVLTNGGHDAEALAPVAQEKLRWLDHWLKGANNGVDKEPPVTVFWEVQIPGTDFSQEYEISAEQFSRAKAGWTTTYSDWPVPHLQPKTFYLTQDAMLSCTSPTVHPDEGLRSYLYPTGTELVGSMPQFALAPRSTGSLHYRTDPMDEDMALLGNPEIRLYFSSDQTDTDFMVTLKDLDPENNATYLTRGFLRASLREIDPARTRPDEINQSFREVQKLTPGETYEVTFSLRTVGHVLRKGHRLELSILAPCDIPSPVFGSTPIGSPSLNKIYHSQRFPSKLVLPIVPAEKAGAPPPASGALWFQPSRKGTASSRDWRGGIVRLAPRN